MTSATKAERDARLYWCDEHDRWFVRRTGCPGSTVPFPRLETFACQDGLHAFCDGSGTDDQRRAVTCQCPCHRAEHIIEPDVTGDPLSCWCRPYRDTDEPEVIIHRKEGAS